MCGIIGIKFFSKTPEKSDQNSVLSALKLQNHRGPDFSGSSIVGKAVLGHNRLAIIDIDERSNQPFADPTGRYTLVFNGEIYNFPELKNELLAKGYQFNTSSDTEVLLFSLIEYGTSVIKNLDGCFAFAFYDSKEDRLVLARDHMGINPLLFSIRDDRILFASELTPFHLLDKNYSLDDKSVRNFFTFTYIASPDTIFKEVQKLYPGHFLEVKGENFDFVKYWDKEAKKSNNRPKTNQKARDLLERSVLKRMNADVPLGTFLSGGVDSSIISALAADFKPDLKTFSIGFEDAKFFDESQYALKVADHIGSNHHQINISVDDMAEALPSILDCFDEPFADSSAIAMYFLSAAAKKEVTVCLSGDGADELLAGYNKHQAYLKANQLSLIQKEFFKLGKFFKASSRNSLIGNKTRQLNRFANLLSRDWPDNYWFLASFNDSKTVDQLMKKSKDQYKHPMDIGISSLSSFLYADQSYVLPGDMLKKVDLMSMRHSLEVRVPFLDKDWVKFVNSLGDEYKYKNGKTKVLLQEAFGDLIPSQIFERKKQGFEVPLHSLILKSWESLVEEKWFKEDYLAHQAIFNYNFVKELKTNFFKHRRKESPTLMWAYLVFQHWYSKWERKK